MERHAGGEHHTARPASWRSSLVVGVAAAALIGGTTLAVFRFASVEPPMVIVQPSAALSAPPPLLPSYDTAAQVTSPTPTAEPTPSAVTSSAAPTRSPARPTPTQSRPAPVATSSSAPAPRASSPSSRGAPAPQFSAVYVTSSDWQHGFVANIEVTNQTSAPAHFEMRVTYPPHVRVTIQQYWGDVTVTSSGRSLRIAGRSAVAGGGTLHLGFLAGKSTHHRVNPVSCTINGAPCRV